MEDCQIPPLNVIDRPVDAEHVTGLANGPGDVGNHRPPIRTDRREAVICVVERGTCQIVHRGIDNDEWAARARFNPNHPRQQHAG